MLVYTARLALDFRRAYIAASRRQDIRFADGFISLVKLALGEVTDKLRDVDVRRTMLNASWVIALTAITSQVLDVVYRGRSSGFVDGCVYPGIPWDTTGTSAVPHDLGASRAGDADLSRIEFPRAHQVANRIGIGKRHAAQAHECHRFFAHVGRRQGREELAQP